MTTHQTNFIANPKQQSFIESQAKADLFCSRMGEGKSTALAWAALYHTRHNPGANWLMIRDTWENIQKTTMKTFFDWFPPGIYGTFKWNTKTFTWASGIAEGSVEFSGMESPDDASKLMSRELAGIGIDEPAPAVGSAGIDEMILDVALSRLRQPKMKWYAAKLAVNNPDEAHWTYRRFVNPGHPDFRYWQPATPENAANLPASYYAELRSIWQHRPDLIRRFVDGEFGFQAIGKQVTPQWSDKLHLALGLIPLPKYDIHLLWDFGHNPTCIVTQKTPMGNWLILDALVGDDIGVEELIEQAVVPLISERYRNCPLHHIGDPQGSQREQTSISRSAVKSIKNALGGTWRPGPVKWEERRDPLQAVLTRTSKGRGVVQVDRDRAAAVWHALRGGYHYHVTRTSIVSTQPVKDIHSHPGDAMGYGAAVLFPLGKRLLHPGDTRQEPRQASYFGNGGSGPLGFERPYAQVPSHGAVLPKIVPPLGR